MNALFTNHDRNGFHHRRARRARGFTLTEILIAIALIVAIVAVAVGNGTTVINGGQTQAAKLFVTDAVATPLSSYRLDTGSFPTTAQGLNALIAAPEGMINWKGPYLAENIKSTPLDPWQHAYHYQSPGTHNPKSYDVWSDGPDGLTGTADDVGNW